VQSCVFSILFPVLVESAVILLSPIGLLVSQIVLGVMFLMLLVLRVIILGYMNLQSF
jgi:hypothetical protein